MSQSRLFSSIGFAFALSGLVVAQTGMADSAPISDAAAAAKAQGTKVSFAPQERGIGGPSAREPAAAIAESAELRRGVVARVFAAETARDHDLLDLLDLVLGGRVWDALRERGVPPARARVLVERLARAVLAARPDRDPRVM